MAHRLGISIDMTPMVDLGFLLLIFFMSTTQFKPPEKIAVALPASQSEVHVPETDTIILTVNKEGEIYISGESAKDTQQVDKDNVVNAVLTWRTRNPAAVVILKGDKAADCGTISDVMKALAEAKTLRFNLMTDLKQKKKTLGE